MARIRSVKPEFFTAESVAALSIPARLHFVGLWTFADDQGRGVDNPRLLKAALWPLDDDMGADNVDVLMCELAAAGKVLRYVVDGRRFFQIDGFRDHQKPNRPVPSKIPQPPSQELSDDLEDHLAGLADAPSVSTHEQSSEDAVSPHGALIPVVEGRVEEGRGDIGLSTRSTQEQPVDIHALLETARSELGAAS